MVDYIAKIKPINADKIEALLRVVKPYGIQNLARTGATGFSRDFS